MRDDRKMTLSAPPSRVNVAPADAAWLAAIVRELTRTQPVLLKRADLLVPMLTRILADRRSIPDEAAQALSEAIGEFGLRALLDDTQSIIIGGTRRDPGRGGG